MVADRRGLAWALLSAVSIAGFAIPWKLANLEGDPAVNALILLAAAALFNSALTGVQTRAWPRFSRVDGWVAAALAVLSLAGNVLSAEAILRISPALLSVVQRGEVIIVALLAWPLIGERVDARFWLGAAIAAVGVLVMQAPFEAGDVRAIGIGIAVASSVCFGAMAVVTRKFVHHIDVIGVNALRLWMSVALWFLWHGAPAGLWEVTPSQALFASLAAFFGPFAGRLSMMIAARTVEARLISLVILLAPLITLVLAYVILGDLPSSRELQGSAIMLVGVAIPILGLARGGPR